MKITFLGISGALSSEYNSNMLIENDKDVMLFDCGEDIMHSLKAAGRNPEELDAVFLSHLHSDHSFGLSWLGYYSYFIMKKRIPLHIHESLVSDLWSMLRPAMEKLDGMPTMMTLNDYFDIRPIRNEKGGFLFGGGSFNLAKQIHVETSFGNMYSYGLVINIDRKKVFISSDTERLNIPHSHYGSFPDLLFCDVDVMNLSGVHPNYDELKSWTTMSKKNMWLYHYHDLGDNMPDAVADGFAGFVKEGQIFEV